LSVGGKLSSLGGYTGTRFLLSGGMTVFAVKRCYCRAERSGGRENVPPIEPSHDLHPLKRGKAMGKIIRVTGRSLIAVVLFSVAARFPAFAQAPDTLLLNGRNVTLDPSSYIGEALAVRDGGIGQLEHPGIFALLPDPAPKSSISAAAVSFFTCVSARKLCIDMSSMMRPHKGLMDLGSHGVTLS
jgi:hypothetical protein